MYTLAGLCNKVHMKGRTGKNGTGKNKDGGRGEDTVVQVPYGTIMRELYTQQGEGDLRIHDQELVVTSAGRGGRGNAAFKTRRRTAPRLG